MHFTVECTIMEKISNFVVFEGGDGSGTTTQLHLLERRLKQAGLDGQKMPAFFTTFEPTEGPIGRIIRAALKNEITITPQTLAYLFASDRNEHIYGKNGIRERAARGELVISDRYAMSSLVYQGIECGDELPNLLNSRFPAPEVIIFLDIEPEIALARMKDRSSLEIYEYRDFQEKVREKYKSLLTIYSNHGTKVEVIDAAKNEQEVAKRVWEIVSQLKLFQN